jgi:HD-GYP domain-containing protein (c-di-GMP phosphodiesterase class II)
MGFDLSGSSHEEEGIPFKDLKDVLDETSPPDDGEPIRDFGKEDKETNSAETLYQQAVLDREQVIKDLLEGKQPSLRPLDRIITSFVEALSTSSDLLVTSFSHSEDQSYPLFKSVNHSILAIKMGMGFEKYVKRDLIRLGVACLICDVGMWKIPRELIFKIGSLSHSEHAEIKRHPIYSGEMLKVLKSEHQWLRTVAEQSHERENGSGYPDGLKGDEIHEFAKIIGVVESYEAITHYRPYRVEGSHTPDEAIKELIKVQAVGGYPWELIRTLVRQLSVFPPGSWVSLNTGEIGRVLDSNSLAPLRPKVEVLFDSSRKRLREPKLKVLDQDLLVYITGCVNPRTLPDKGRG